MCTCCYTTSGGLRQYTGDFEPATSHPFDDLWERKLTTVQQVKGENRTDEWFLNDDEAQINQTSRSGAQNPRKTRRISDLLLEITKIVLSTICNETLWLLILLIVKKKWNVKSRRSRHDEFWLEMLLLEFMLTFVEMKEPAHVSLYFPRITLYHCFEESVSYFPENIAEPISYEVSENKRKECYIKL